MRDRQTCIDCGKKSPETETNYTLISAQFGWRLTRRRADNGDFVVEWRCPECWRAHKKRTQDDPPSSPQHKTLADRAPAPSPPARAAAPVGTRSSRPPPPSAPTRPSSRPPPSSVPVTSTPRTRRP